MRRPSAIVSWIIRAATQGAGTRLACGLRAAAVACLIASAGPGLAQERGTASATGSDALSLNGHAYQLFGIDSFRLHQSCFIDGRPLACGVSAVRALQTLLDPAAVTCTPKGAATSGAMLATCMGHDGDVALRLVEQGWALADGAAAPDYIAAEAAARDGKMGAWRGTFLAPEAYTAQMAAIETRYAGLAADSARAEAEADLAAGKLDFGGLGGVAAAAAAADGSGAGFVVHEVRFDGFSPGFIDDAVEPPEVFDWARVAGVLEATRRKGVEAVTTSVTHAIWDELAQRPARTIATRNEGDFYAALTSSSAGWLGEGRRPILFVMAPDLPNWVRRWFAGQPPAGAEISRRGDRSVVGYIGTIDGVDVHVGPGRQRAALLVPSDILSAITYRQDADGQIVALRVAAQNEWVMRYGMALRWRNEALVWLAFPQMASPTPDAD